MAPNLTNHLPSFCSSDDKIAEKEKYEEPRPVARKFVAPDGGWGWMVLLGTFVTLFISSGIVKLCGILLIHIMQEFRATTLEASIISSIMMSLLNLLGPVSSALCHFYSSRLVVILSGTFTAAGLILTFFAANVETLYLTLGVLVGSASGLNLIPCVLVICEYFKKRRGLASGIMLSGASLGAVAFPPLTSYLLEEYNLKGTLLILGGISLNMFVAGSLLQPVKYHMVEVPDYTQVPANFTKPNKIISGSMASLETVKEIPETDDQQFVTTNQVLIDVNEPYDMDDTNVSQDLTLGGEAFLQPHENAKNILMPTDINNSVISIPHSTALSFGRNKILSKSSSLSSSFAQLSVLHLNPVILKELENPERSVNTWIDRLLRRNSKKKVKKLVLIEFSWLKNALFIILGIANVCTCISWYGILIFFPSHMDNMGITQGQIAKVLSVIALTDFSGRIIFPFLYDLSCCHIKYWYMFGVVASGLVIFTVTLATAYEHFLTVAGLYGLLSGCFCGLSSLIYVEMLGEENVSSSYSLSLLICGIFLLGMPPAVGWIREVSGSYSNCFVIFGIIQLIGGLSLLFEPCASRYETVKEFKRLRMESEISSGVIQSDLSNAC